MKRFFLCFLTFLMLLLAQDYAYAQSSDLTVEIQDIESQPTSQTVDGNRIRLRAEMNYAVKTETQVEFFLEGTAISSCVIATNETACVTEFIETLGWGWVEGGVRALERTIQARAGNEAGEAVLKIQPRPVVFIHGMISMPNRFDSYIKEGGYLSTIGLTGYSVGDGQFPGRMNAGDPLKPAERGLTIAENAAQIKLYVDALQKETHAEQVDLIAHSMGGLFTRYYLANLTDGSNISQLIMLGTPNGGSPCGGALASLDFYMPSSLELHPSYINGIFNKQVVETHGVPVYAVAGSLITNPSISPCSGVPSDTTVSLASVAAVPLDVVGQIELEHNFLPTNKELFERFVRPLLQTTAEGFASLPDLEPASTVDNAQFTQTYTGHLDPGGNASVTISIDPDVSVASFGLFDSTRSLTVSVQGTSGKTLELDLENKGLVIEDPETLLYLGYGFENPKPGAWVVTLSTTDETPSYGADYALYASFVGGAVLNAQVDELTPRLGESLTISAALEGADIESAKAKILLPNGAQESVVFTRNGNLFEGTFSPTQPGLHGIEISVLGKTPEGVNVDRAAMLAFEAQPTPTSPVLTQARFIGILVGIILLIALPIVVIVNRRRKMAVQAWQEKG